MPELHPVEEARYRQSIMSICQNGRFNSHELHQKMPRGTSKAILRLVVASLVEEGRLASSVTHVAGGPEFTASIKAKNTPKKPKHRRGKKP